MDQKYLTICRKIKAAALLLFLFFMMVNTCPVRSFLTSAFTHSIEFSKQSSSSNTFVYDDLRCSESEITKASLLDFSISANSSLPLPLFLTVISLYLSLSIIGSGFRYWRKERELFLTDFVPLFLQNRSIII